jgi:hypothetical protein
MLDSTELAKRLRAAMDNHNPAILSVDMAEKCGVTRQAVNAWRKTGRVHKRHLQTIALMTGQPVEFFLEDERASSKTTRVSWQRLGAALAVMLALVALPAPDARASFSANVVASVYYVKSLLRRVLFHLALCYQKLRSASFARI